MPDDGLKDNGDGGLKDEEVLANDEDDDDKERNR